MTLLTSHVIGIAIYWQDRREAVVRTEAHDFAERVAGMVTMLGHLPGEWYETIVRESDGRTFHVTLDPTPEASGRDLDENLSAAVALYLKRQLSDLPSQKILVKLNEAPFISRGETVNVRPAETDGAAASEGDEESRIFLHVSIGLGEGKWLNFVGGMPDSQSIWLTPFGAYILSVVTGVGAVAMWLVFRVTAPFTAFARAADRLGKDIRAEALPEGGPTEVSQAAHAFNAMQQRLRRLIENRTQILAALSHDLKTPLTLLKLRVELMEDSEEQAKILHTIEEMEAMVASVLEFTKATLLNEPLRNVDLSALLSSICDDMAVAGTVVEIESAEKTPYTCRIVSLKRALTNLINNAVKYGGNARVRLARQGAGILVQIDDDGPGIPEDQQEAVFMPFYRIDESRSEDEGGVGLGLSIAQTIIQGHGGYVEVANRPEGGFRVTVTLPQ